MPQPQIPEILKQRLQFGNDEQIRALRDYENRLKSYFGGEGEKRWCVFIEVEGARTMHVTAATKEEAEEKAREETDLCLSDFDVSYVAKPAGN